MLKEGIYNFKTEFWEAVGINAGQWTRRREDLLEWLKNFYDYEILKGKPMRIRIKVVFGEYQPLPRKVVTLDRIKRYEEFVKQELPDEFTFLSKAKMAREAIEEFGYAEFGHESVPAVSRRYVGPAMEKYGEKNENYQWVWYKSYRLLSEEALADWRNILREANIDEQNAANAFYRYASGEDITKEINYYKEAQKRFKEKYGDIAIRVSQWKKN